jgi:cytochrome c2
MKSTRCRAAPPPIAVAVLAATLLLKAPAAVGAEADPAAGQRVFGRCVACHSTEPGQTKIGPSLAGVFGRRSGAATGFDYSAALKNANVVWDEAALDQYLAGPTRFMPGTKMFIGLPNGDDRRNVIEYLKTLTP